MKKLALSLIGLFAQSSVTFAQSVEINVPSLDEGGLSTFLSSTVLQAVILAVAGLAAAMALFYLLGNLRMVYDTNTTGSSYSSRFPSPTESETNLSRSAFGEFVPQLVPVDHEIEEEKDGRKEKTGQRGG